MCLKQSVLVTLCVLLDSKGIATTCTPDMYRPALAVDVKVIFDKGEIIPTETTLVDEQLSILYDSFLTSELHRTKKINEQVKAVHVANVSKVIGKFITCRILVGHTLSQSLDLLRLAHPQHLRRDTMFLCENFVKDTKTDCLKTLATNYGEVNADDSNSYENALAVMRLYSVYRLQWEEYFKYYIPIVALACVAEKPGIVRTVVVNVAGSVSYDELINLDKNTPRPANLTMERELLKTLITDKIVVGYDLEDDLSTIGIKHPSQLVRVVKKFFPFRKKFPNVIITSLKDLAEKLLKKEIGTLNVDPVEDARVLMELYIKYRDQFNEQAKNEL